MRIGLSCICVCHSSTSANRFFSISRRKPSGPSAISLRWARTYSGEPMPSEHSEAMIRFAPGSRMSSGATIPLTVW